MPTISSRIYSTGVLTANGSFDEVTYNTNASANAVVNLAVYSQDTTASAWTGSGYNRIITSNSAVAPDGSFTATRFAESSDVSAQIHGFGQSQSTYRAGQRYTISFFMKSFSADRAFIFGVGSSVIGGTNQYVYAKCDPDSGTIINSLTYGPAAQTTAVTNAGNGWYRFSLSFLAANTASGQGVDIQFQGGAGKNQQTYIGNGTSGVLFWGLQIEESSSATPYQPKVASTNLLNYSTDLTNVSYWVKNPGFATVTANATIAPDGTLSAFKFVADAGVTGRKSLYQSKSVIPNTTYTWSLYVKSAGFANTSMWIDPTPASLLPSTYQGAGSLISLIDGSKSGGAPSQTNVTPVGNGWYRISTTATTTATTSSVNLTVALGEPNGSGTAVGDGVTGIFIWGPQFEKVTDPKITPYYNVPSTYKPTSLNTNIVLSRFVKSDSANNYFIAGEYDEVTYNTTTPIIKNLFSYSEEYDNGAWINSNITLSPNSALAPDGTLTADTFTATNDDPYIRQQITITAGLTYTASFYIKGAANSSGKTGFIWPWYLLTATGTNYYGSKLYTITTEWQRVFFTFTAESTGTATIRVDLAEPAAVGDTFYLWGAQFEVSPNPTDYQGVRAANTLIPPRFRNRITFNGDNYVTGSYDERSGIPVSEGLIVYLDASLAPSYNGSGTNWTGISSNKANASITSSSGGVTTSYGFNKAFDTITLNDGNLIDGQIRITGVDFNTLAQSNNFTVMFAAKKDYYGSSGNLVGNSELFQAVNNGYGTGWRITEESQGSLGTPFTGTHAWNLSMSPAATPSGWGLGVSDTTTNRMCIVAFSVSPTTVYGFCNGNTTTTTNPGTYAGSTSRGWISFTGAGAGSFNGQIGFFMVYNRALSLVEMTQNYNAFRRRYNL